MNTVLHIGTEKTGTTTIQTLLDLNRRALAERQRVAISRSCGIGNNRDLATYAIRDDYFNDDQLIELGITDSAAKSMFKRQVEARLRHEMQSLADSCEQCVLSSEHFQSRLKSAEEIATLRSLLEGVGLRVTKVIVYLRDPAMLIQSMYSNSLRAGSAATSPEAAAVPHWNHICDHQGTLQRWNAVFGDAEIVPRIFDTREFRDGNLIADFCDSADIDMEGLELPRNMNASLNATGQALLRQINHERPWLLATRHRALRAEIVAYVNKHFAGRALPPSAALVASCEARFAESNEWVRQAYFPERARLFDPVMPVAHTAVEDDASEGGIAGLAEAERWLTARLRQREPAV